MTIRPATEADAARVAAIYAPYVRDTTVSFEAEPPTAEEMAARMRAVLPRYPWLVAEEEGDVVGYAYASAHGERAAYRWSVDVSVYLAPGAHGQGLGRRLYEELFARLRGLGYVTAHAAISEPNPPSRRFHEAVGFAYVGEFEDVGYKHGRWLGVSWWRLALVPRPEHPAEPRPAAQTPGTGSGSSSSFSNSSAVVSGGDQ